MKHRLYLFVLLLSITAFASAQQQVSVQLEQRPVVELFDAIEKQTGYRVYCPVKVSEGVTVTVNVTNGEPMQVLKDALANTILRVTLYNGDIFVTRNTEMRASLPEGFFNIKESTPILESEDTGILLALNRADQKASSENKVYEVGVATGETADRVTLTGRITNFQTGEPLANVTIVAEGQQRGTTTNAYGNYTIQLPAGRNELAITAVGLKDTKRQVLIYSSGKLDIEVEEQVYSLSEVTISSSMRENVRSTTMGVTRLEMSNIKNIPTAFGEVDIMRVVMSLPGVKAVGEASSGFNVRGGATDQNLILFNDGTIYNPTHLFGFFSVFNPDILRDMELYKSSVPAKYGGRISSVLDINTREGNKEKFTGSASLGLLTSRLAVEGPIGEKTSFIAGGRTTYSDWILKQLPEKSEYKDGNAGFYDMNAVINHRFDTKNSLQASGYFSRDRFNFNADEKYAYRNANASLKWRHIFNDDLSAVFTGGYDHYDYKTYNTENPVTSYDLSFGIDQYYGKADFTWLPHNKHRLDFGASSLMYNLNPGHYAPRGDASLVIDDLMQQEKALESAVYISDRWDITSAFSVDLGLRYTMYNAMGPRIYNLYEPGVLPSEFTVIGQKEEGSGIYKTYQGPEVRASVRYEFLDGLSIKAGFNTMRQNIHKLSNTTVMSPTDTWKLSDANIKPQTGRQGSIGLYKNFAEQAIELSAEAYYKTMDDYLDYRNGAELLMNHHIETDVLSTEGRAYGLEFMIKKLTGNLNGWVSYTYSRTELRQNDPRNLKPVNRGEWYPADYDKPHDVKFVGNYKFTQRFSVSLNVDYSTGRPVTIPVSKFNYAGGEFVYFSDRNQYRIPDFFRMDFSMTLEPSHHLTLFTHSTFSLGVYNLTGRKNAYSVYYIAEDGKLKGYKLAIFGMPIPYLSYNIKF